MNVVGVIIIQYKQVLVSSFRCNWVASGKIGCHEFFESVQGDRVLNGVGVEGVDSQVMVDGLFLWRWLCWCRGRLCCLYSLSDFVHVAQGCLNLGMKVSLYMFYGEPWPPDVVPFPYGLDPGSFNGVPCGGVVVVY